MKNYEQYHDAFRWGLHHPEVCPPSNSGLPCDETQYGCDLSQNEFVHEGYYEGAVHNTMGHGFSHYEAEHLQSYVRSESCWEASNRRCTSGGREVTWHNGNHRELNGIDLHSSYADADADHNLIHGGNLANSPEMVDEYILDGKMSKILNQMNPIPHVPKVNGAIQSHDEASSDRERLLERLNVYNLVQLKIAGDGNCQFRALSDQIYHNVEHHKFVREQIVNQLKSYPELYMNYVPMCYDEYLKKMSMSGEWGDHVTLQAAADLFGIKIFIITSFKDTCYIEILPRREKSKRIIFLSFWAEVHYNSIYSRGADFPETQTKRKKWWRS